MPAGHACASVSQQELITLEGELWVPCSLGEEVGGSEETLRPGNNLRRVCFGELETVSSSPKHILGNWVRLEPGSGTASEAS